MKRLAACGRNPERHAKPPVPPRRISSLQSWWNRLGLALLAGCIAAPGIWAQAVETPEGFLGNLTPIIDSIQLERGYALDYEHRGSLSTTAWRMRGRGA